MVRATATELFAFPQPVCSRNCRTAFVPQVLVGAEGVVESGGIINKLGTFQVRRSHTTLARA